MIPTQPSSHIPQRFYINISNSKPPAPWIPEAQLLVRANNGDPAVTKVPMWETKTVDIPPGQKAEIFTYGLCENTAIAVLSKHGDGTRSITLSQYPLHSKDIQLHDLDRELRTESHSITNPNVQHEIYVITPNSWAQDHEGEWISRALEEALVADIEKKAQALLPEIQPKVLLYSKNREPGTSSAFVLQVPDQGDKPIRYEGLLYGECGF